MDSTEGSAENSRKDPTLANIGGSAAEIIEYGIAIPASTELARFTARETRAGAQTTLTPHHSPQSVR